MHTCWATLTELRQGLACWQAPDVAITARPPPAQITTVITCLIALRIVTLHIIHPLKSTAPASAPRRSPLREVVFAVRSICPLIAALLLLVKLVLRVPLPKITFWLPEPSKGQSTQDADQASYSVCASMRQTGAGSDDEDETPADAVVNVRASHGGGSSIGGTTNIGGHSSAAATAAAAAAGENGSGGGVSASVSAAVHSHMDIEAIEGGGASSVALIGGAAGPAAGSGKAGGAAEAAAPSESGSGGWLPLLLGFAMCQVSGPTGPVTLSVTLSVTTALDAWHSRRPGWLHSPHGWLWHAAVAVTLPCAR